MSSAALSIPLGFRPLTPADFPLGIEWRLFFAGLLLREAEWNPSTDCAREPDLGTFCTLIMALEFLSLPTLSVEVFPSWNVVVRLIFVIDPVSGLCEEEGESQAGLASI